MQRLREFDFIRAVAALSVIAIHITGIYVYSSRAGYLWNQGMRYAVPLFIILSGLLLYYSEMGKRPQGFFEFINKRLRKVFVPFLLWTAVYVLFNLRHNPGAIWTDAPGFIISFCKHILLGTGAFHLYFVVIIVQMYVLYPLIRYLLQKWTSHTLAVSFVITLFFQTAIYLQNIKAARILTNYWIPYYLTFLPWLFFFVFGMYFVIRMERWKEKLSGRFMLAGSAWMVSFAVLVADSVLTRSNEASIKPSVMLYCMLSFAYFYLAAERFKNTASVIGRLLDWFSSQSFLIYLSHILILDMLVICARKIGLPGLWQGKAGMVLLFIATTLCTSIFVYLMSMTPFVSLIGGVRAVNAHVKRETDTGA